MTQLAHMRTRIKAINTIAKITHAMQLIAMADHIRLRERKTNFERYQQAISELFVQLSQQRGHCKKNSKQEPQPPEKVLYVMVGSQKGLCGSFNTNLLYEVTKLLKLETHEHADLIIIGKKLKDYLKPFRQNLPYPTKIVAEHNNFVWANMATIAQAVLAQAVDTELGYTKVVLYGHKPEGFFSQRILATQLLPLLEAEVTDMEAYTDREHMGAPEILACHNGISEDPEIIFTKVKQQYLLSTLEFVLLQSLLAEQASRFVSMDSATRNTKKLRENMQTQFNKLRQTKITTELTELASNV